MKDVIDAEFRLVRPAGRFRFWRFAAFCFFVTTLAGGAYEFGATEADGFALVGLVICAALIAPTGRLLASFSERASDEEAEWLRDRLIDRGRTER